MPMPIYSDTVHRQFVLLGAKLQPKIGWTKRKKKKASNRFLKLTSPLSFFIANFMCNRFNYIFVRSFPCCRL